MFTPAIDIGDTVTNDRIVNEFQCSPQGGMRRSHKTNTLVLVSKHVVTKYKVYDDRKIGNLYHYTGMGMSGDQSLSFAQNKTLAESKENGIDIHFFEVFKEGEYIYIGRAELAEEPYESHQEDENRVRRTVWVFPLKLLHENDPKTLIQHDLLDQNYESQEKIAYTLSDAELTARAVESSSVASSRKVITKTYLRSPYIAELTKRRAGGKCELCQNAAPFLTKGGDRYLESHHIQWLSKNGPDSIDNTAGLCANCHKRMHVRDERKDVEYLLSLRKDVALS